MLNNREIRKEKFICLPAKLISAFVAPIKIVLFTVITEREELDWMPIKLFPFCNVTPNYRN